MYRTQTVTVTRKTHYLHFTKENGQIFGRDLHGAVENIPRNAEMGDIAYCPCGCGGASISFIEEKEVVDEIPVIVRKMTVGQLLDEIFDADTTVRDFERDVFSVKSFPPEERLKRWYKDLKPRMLKIVGYSANIPELRTCEHYDALYQKCMSILDL